jgi:hypothetical protein
VHPSGDTAHVLSLNVLFLIVAPSLIYSVKSILALTLFLEKSQSIIVRKLSMLKSITELKKMPPPPLLISYKFGIVRSKFSSTKFNGTSARRGLFIGESLS